MSRRGPGSSYLAMIGEAVSPAWLQTEWVLAQFSKKRKIAIRKYTDFVRDGVGLPSLWGDLKQQIYLGDDNFVAQMQNKIELSGDLKETLRVQRRKKAKALSDYLAYDNAKLGMDAAYQTGDYTMNAIAQDFGVHYSTVSRS